MHFEPLPLAGAFRVLFDHHEDERGSFWRTFCRETFRQNGLDDCSNQCSMAVNRRKGTLRGMHFQKEPHGESKLLFPVHGSVFDVLVDLRPESATFGHWHGETLTSEHPTALYVPRSFAHGYLTLEDDSSMVYQMDAAYVPDAAAGFCWDDADVAIAWPFEPTLISSRDRTLPAFSEL